MALVGDHARQIAAFADAEQHRLGRQRPFRHAAEPFDTDKTVVLYPADHETELIHVGEQHDRGRVGIALERGDQVAEAVAARDDPKLIETASNVASDAVFMAAEPGNHHQGRQGFAQAVLHGH